MHRRTASLCLAGFAAIVMACSGERAPATPAVTLADTGATTNPPAELPMDVQHRTMDSIESNYVTLLTALGAKDKAGATQAARNIAALTDRIPVFMIHKEDVTTDSLQRWSKMFKGEALRTAELADAGSWDEAQAMAGRLNQSCANCHALYRTEAETHEEAEGAHKHAPGQEH